MHAIKENSMGNKAPAGGCAVFLHQLNNWKSRKQPWCFSASLTYIWGRESHPPGRRPMTLRVYIWTLSFLPDVIPTSLFLVIERSLCVLLVNGIEISVSKCSLAEIKAGVLTSSVVWVITGTETPFMTEKKKFTAYKKLNGKLESINKCRTLFF